MSETKATIQINQSTVELGGKQIIERAIHCDATDIHLEPMERFIVVRYRRGGVLYVANKLPKAAALPLTGYLKELAKLDVNQTKASQTGQTTLKVGRHNYQLTMSTMPLIDGEKITVHIQPEVLNVPTLEQLGLWGKSLAQVEYALGLPKGMIVVCGIQTAQISQTIASLLNVYSARPIKTALIDENIQLLPPAISHFVPSPKSTFSHSHYLKLLQRRGTGVIGVNPVLTKTTAKEVVAAARKGHLVVAGVPSANVAEGLIFLSQLSSQPLGIDFGGVAIGQIIVRGLCPFCRQAYQPDSAELAGIRKIYKLSQPKMMEYINQLEIDALSKGIGSDPDLSSSKKNISRLWRAHPHGCKKCDYSGYNGAVGIFEVCPLNDVRGGQLMKARSAAGIYQSTIEEGMIPLNQDGLIKALRGLVDLPTIMSL
ncbi:MAG TPA: ATPase, T2SS/T4P/T4SS family [Patescibacteria group bacterium]|jgi:type II secretory ATPase GspE/PulE/Tfp pilus assembly ATPase PilB-like protein|nr:ATPase, T2SS/T4P/T4SS family [Patescibacteria group bacterium]